MPSCLVVVRNNGEIRVVELDVADPCRCCNVMSVHKDGSCVQCFYTHRYRVMGD